MAVHRSRSSSESPADLPPCSRVPRRGLSFLLPRATRLLWGFLTLVVLIPPPAGHGSPGGGESAAGQALDDLFRSVERSVVQVVAYRPTGPEAGFGGGSGMVRLEPSRSTIWATGVVLDNRGFVLTCAEAAQPGDSIQIRLADRSIVGARFLAQDVERGVSLIQADQSDGLVPVRIEEGVKPGPGAILAVFNYEAGMSRTRVRLATLGATMPGPPGQVSLLRLDMTDCLRGCGGAVIDGQGRFRGMLIHIRSERERDSGPGHSTFAENLLECERVFALSSEAVPGVIRALELRSHNQVGFLGVRAEIGGDMDASGAAGSALSTGRLIVVHVLPGSPAETAGILPGDHILSIGGRPVADPNEITERIAAFRPGTTVAVGLLRNGAPLVVHPRLGDRSALEWLIREEEQNQARQTRVRKSIRQLEEHLRMLEQQRSRFR